MFFEVHKDLPREGPGSDASTRRALGIAGPLLGDGARVVDVACGPGAQTLVLERELRGARIQALDFHAPFLEQLRGRLPEEHSVEIVHGDMKTWSPDGPVDLVWCEGAAYIMGVPEALGRWAEWLAPGGVAAFSEAVWLTDTPHEVAAKMWEEYPEMLGLEACLEMVRGQGYEVLGHFVLPASDWLVEYYGPMQARVDMLTEKHREDAESLALLEPHQHEIDVCRAHGDDYGYVFIVCTPT